MAANAKQNKSGQRIGRKGEGTRRRLLEATEALLTQSRGLPPSLTAIAREAAVSPPTFYLYFNDVSDAIYATVERINERLEPIVALLEEDWPPNEAYGRALTFVEAFFAYWEDNAAVLRARNRLADEGSDRFVEARLASVERLTQLLAGKIGPAVVEGQEVASPYRLAGTLVTAIERIATAIALDVYTPHVEDWEGSKRALAYQIALLTKD